MPDCTKCGDDYTLGENMEPAKHGMCWVCASTYAEHLEECLRNMVGYFGGAHIRLKLGKMFTQEMAEILRDSKRTIHEPNPGEV